MSLVELPVKSPNWRTWSVKELLEDSPGAWRVEIQDADGNPLEGVKLRSALQCSLTGAGSLDVQKESAKSCTEQLWQALHALLLDTLGYFFLPLPRAARALASFSPSPRSIAIWRRLSE